MDIVAVRRRIVAVRRGTVVDRPGIVADLPGLSPKNERIVADRRGSSPKDEGMGLVAVRRMVFRVSEREAIVYRRHPFLKRKRQVPYKEARWERRGHPVAVRRQKRRKRQRGSLLDKERRPLGLCFKICVSLSLVQFNPPLRRFRPRGRKGRVDPLGIVFWNSTKASSMSGRSSGDS